MSDDKADAPDEPLDVAALLHRVEQGWRPKFVFFWGHSAKTGGAAGKGAAGKHVLSQWWMSEFEVDGVRYPTAEHYMMAEKARLFGDDDALTRILASPSPGAAKALGRQVRNFAADKWDAACFDIVARGNEAKFGQNEELRTYLLNTGDKVLVEASPVDRIWGVGLAADDPHIENPKRWSGANLLGFALMKARVALRDRAFSNDQVAAT
jgi:ribA/ribD-fused uncharacterized protein